MVDISKLQDVSEFANRDEMMPHRLKGLGIDIKDIFDKEICIEDFIISKNGNSKDLAVIQFFFLDNSQQTPYKVKTTSQNLVEFLIKYKTKVPFKTKIHETYMPNNTRYYNFVPTKDDLTKVD